MRPLPARIIPAEELGNVEPFALGAIDSGRRSATASAPRTLADPAARDDALLRQSFEIGYRRGFAEAQARAEQAVDEERRRHGAALAQRIGALQAAMQIELQRFEDHAAERIVDLAVELARRMISDTFECDRGAIVPIAQEALDTLVGQPVPATMRLNPDDLDAVHEQLGPLLARRHVELVADATIASGGCRLTSASAEVDARVDERLRRVLAAIGRPPAGQPPADAR